MNTEDIFRAVAQSFLVSIEAHINKLLDQKLEEFKSQLPQSSETVSDVEFNNRMQVWLENNCITDFVDADLLDLDTAIDQWIGHNLDISNAVEEYLNSNFNIEDKISDALGDISWSLSIN
jgi:hypothetical protein